MRKLHEHWMLIPLSVAILLIVSVLILGGALHWSNGTVGAIITLILAVTAAVGSMLAPREPEQG